MLEETYMRRAIALAKKGVGKTNPNPLVGAVVVKEGRIIGEGYHQKIGDLHAERNALAALSESAEGATIYVTLEPCFHYGKTPPCTEAIIAHKLARVVIGSRDPNPKVAGKGVQILREAGIEVVCDFLREECDALNPIFFHYITRKRPFVALKYAMTADGKIAANSGKSQWITMEKAREHVQELRNAYLGILVGIGTVLLDDPTLTCRREGGRNPVRIVCDSHLRIPLDCKLIRTISQAPLILAYVEGEEGKKKDLAEAGVKLLVCEPDENGRVSILNLLQKLGEMEIDGLLVEGGSEINAAFLKAGCVNRIYSYIGAQIFGGRNRFTPIGGSGIDEPKESLKLRHPRVTCFGEDVLICYDCEERDSERRSE